MFTIRNMLDRLFISAAHQRAYLKSTRLLLLSQTRPKMRVCNPRRPSKKGYPLHRTRCILVPPATLFMIISCVTWCHPSHLLVVVGGGVRGVGCVIGSPITAPLPLPPSPVPPWLAAIHAAR